MTTRPARARPRQGAESRNQRAAGPGPGAGAGAAGLVVAAIALGAVTGTARADPLRGWSFGGALSLSAEAATLEPRGGGERVNRLVLGESVRGVAGVPVGPALGLDVRLGAEWPGAFVYRATLLPLGLGVKLGQRSFVAVLGGIGPGGSTAWLPFAWELPLELTLAFDLGPWIRVHGAARVTATPWTSARQHGSDHAPFGDELELSAGLSIGRRTKEWMASYSDGTYLGVTYREQAGEQMVGLALALSIDVGSKAR